MEDDLLHANAHSRTTAKRCQVFLEVLSISRVHPAFRREVVRVREDLGVLVDELLSQAHGRLQQAQTLTFVRKGLLLLGRDARGKEYLHQQE